MGEAAVQEPDVEVVGNAFALQYYHVLHQSPQHVHRFYQDSSKMGRPAVDGAMDISTTLEAIKEKILSLDYGELRAEIKTVDAQESFGGGVLVLVTGYLTGKDDVTRNFTQVFFLAPQEKGYFVLNDAFRYVEDVKSREVENPLTEDNSSQVTPAVENTIDVKEVTLEEPLVPVVCSESPDVTPEEPAAKVVNKTSETIECRPEPISTAKEVQKKSYASMVKVPAVAPSASSAPAAAKDISLAAAKQKDVVAAPAGATALNKEAVENGHQQEEVAEGHSVYIKALPLNATPTLVEAEFKQFGPIKKDGVQVRSSKGFCFGFVAFEEASAALKAIKASPIVINGHEVFIQEKKSTNSGASNKQPFTSGRGNGFRNEEGRGSGRNNRGRGGYGRSGFNNSDHNGKGNNEQGFYKRRTRNGHERYNSNDRNPHPSGLSANTPQLCGSLIYK